jgi:hypothetical protein
MFSDASILTSSPPPFCAGGITCAASGTEVVCQPNSAIITSGGGFSNVAPMPSWQSQQVTSYLTGGALLPPSADFNSSGRSYPDISALAHNYMIVEQGYTTSVDG